jgi:hypothetical protein
VFTKYPTLVDLQGKALVNQTDIEAVQGFTEYMGSTVADKVMVGVQRKSTLPSLYNISSDIKGTTIEVKKRSSTRALQSCGSPKNLLSNYPRFTVQARSCSHSVPAQGKTKHSTSRWLFSALCLSLLLLLCLQEGDDITLTWQFVGVPRTVNCYHDDVLVADCQSPMTISAAGFNESAKHVFTAVLTDVCGNTKNATFSYTSAGVANMTKTDYVAQVGGVDAGSPVTSKKNAATVAGPAGTLLLGGLVALLGMMAL